MNLPKNLTKRGCRNKKVERVSNSSNLYLKLENSGAGLQHISLHIYSLHTAQHCLGNMSVSTTYKYQCIEARFWVFLSIQNIPIRTVASILMETLWSKEKNLFSFQHPVIYQQAIISLIPHHPRLISGVFLHLK